CELVSDAIGRFAAPCGNVSPRLAGDACLAAIRPEEVRLGPAGSGRLAGRVVERSYLGARTRYVIDAERISFVAIADERGAVAVGDVVGIDWRDEAVALVAPEPPSAVAPERGAA
ncbi:MAG TPA: TOBE domain-containing protein, partial [Thermomicrobiales bacterium]|nr:TOBE domain-containing protein [Thermomicrobiales bacterium]